MKFTSENIDQLCRYCAKQLHPNHSIFSCVEPLKDISTTPDQIIRLFKGLEVNFTIKQTFISFCLTLAICNISLINSFLRHPQRNSQNFCVTNA